MLFKAIV